MVVIDKTGEIAEQGSFAELRQLKGYVSQLDTSRQQSSHEEDIMNRSQNTAPQNIETELAVVDLTRKTGDWRIYSFFLGAAGWTNSASFITASFVVAFLFNFPSMSFHSQLVFYLHAKKRCG